MLHYGIQRRSSLLLAFVIVLVLIRVVLVNLPICKIGEEHLLSSNGPQLEKIDPKIANIKIGSSNSKGSNHSNINDGSEATLKQDYDSYQVAKRSTRLLNHLSKTCSDLNISNPITEYTLNHIHFDHKRHVLYCYVPKVACTSWKKIWMKMIGVVSRNTSLESIDRFDVHTKVPFLRGSMKNLQNVLKNYKKIMFVRDPFNRVLSAYKDKLIYNDRNGKYDFHKEIGTKIQSKYRGFSSGGHDVTFPEFISYISEESAHPTVEQGNEHWRSVHDICNPCAIHYDYIGKYENLKEDASYVLEWLDITDIIPQFPGADQPSNAKHYDPKFYNQLKRKQLKSFYKKYLQDYLAFDYSLHNDS